MKLLGIATLWNYARLMYYRWARHDMTRNKPMHPDLPLVLQRCAEIATSIQLHSLRKD